MSVNTIEHRLNLGSADTDRKISPAIWSDCPIAEILDGSIDGYFRRWNFNDFKLATNVNAAEAYWAQALKLYGSDGAAIAALDQVGGGITVGSDGDNEGLAFGQSVFPFQISRSHKKFWFEARLKTSTIADTKHGFFLGLIDSSALSATVPITASGTIADENVVGFHRLEGDGDYVDTVYKADGVTQVTVGADAKVLVADTFVKLGMRFNPDVDGGIHDATISGANRYVLSFFADNVKLSDHKQIPSAAGTDFPNDVRMGVVFAILNATASTPGTVSLDWLQVAQLY